MDFNLAFLAARPLFETGLDARESFFKELKNSNRDRPSVEPMLIAIQNLRRALKAGKLAKIVDALAEIDTAFNACEADGLPGRGFRFHFGFSDEGDRDVSRF